MQPPTMEPETRETIEQVLGYLNFASGASDPRFLANLDRLFRYLEPAMGQPCQSEPSRRPADQPPLWKRLGLLLADQLGRLAGNGPAFRDVAQARGVVRLVFDELVPAYRHFHADLLFHQDDEGLFNSFMIGRFCEAVLEQGPEWNQADRIVEGALGRLNDYLGHRPVATLETEQKIEPYSHEWTRPIPIYIQEAGVAAGKYHDLLETTLRLLHETDRDLLRQACFDPEHLREMAIDARAYDFDHPVNRRPGYQFGQWDPHRIDNRGFYNRFVLQQITLDALMNRVWYYKDIPYEERILEAAAALAGTMLMASGMSGWGPESHDSTVTLASLMPIIAGYRDAFYKRLLARLKGPVAERLRKEAVQRRQPFGAVRQNLNGQLAMRRAAQLERVYLARIFARMGYPEAADRQIEAVPVASARMQCRLNCLCTAVRQSLDRKQPERAARKMKKIVDRLHAAIQCGAIVDPWNILGFDGNFSLFPSPENSIPDHRVGNLVALMDHLFSLFTRIWSEAAAMDLQPLAESVSNDFHELAVWWNRFAAHEVSSVESPHALDAYRAAANVARAMQLWYRGGAAAGNIRFWAPHAEMFDTPRAYALVVDALLDQGDYIASTALLAHWLGRGEDVGLVQGGNSFHKLVKRWLYEMLHCPPQRLPGQESEPPDVRRWGWVHKLFDYLEANGDPFWRVPRFQLHEEEADEDGDDSAPADSESFPLFAAPEEAESDESDESEEEADSGGIYDAAYDDVTFRDSTDDGMEGEIFEYGQPGTEQIREEVKRVGHRLEFIGTLAELWQYAALCLPRIDAGTLEKLRDDRSEHRKLAPVEVLENWFDQASRIRGELARLLRSVWKWPIPQSTGDQTSNVEYDRRRLLKENLLEQIISTCVAISRAVRFISAAIEMRRADLGTESCSKTRLARDAAATGDDQRAAIDVFNAALQGNVEAAGRCWPDLIETLQTKPILYVSLSKGGDPMKILQVRIRQQMIRDLLAWLPHLGLLRETCELIETVRVMEEYHHAGPGAVTNFDDLFQIGYRSLVESIVRAAGLDHAKNGRSRKQRQAAENALFACLEQMTQALLKTWLLHSRTLRLSVLERVSSPQAWQEVVRFIRQYGADLFTQKFLALGNIRAILHQGVDRWIENLLQEPSRIDDWQFLADLDTKLPREEAVTHITIILEAVIENYSEYGDYNSTTTQSDRGEMIYTLLDFLRLRNAYERVAWSLKPIVLAHEVLVRHQLNEAAQAWRRALADRTAEKADYYLDHLEKLQKKYSMRMPTVADRLRERFMRPLIIDRIRSFVEPAVRQADQPGPHYIFELLEEETAMLTETPTGAGLDVPAWLVSLEEEVERACRPVYQRDDTTEPSDILPPIQLSLEEIQRQLDEWQNQNGPTWMGI